MTWVSIRRSCCVPFVLAIVGGACAGKKETEDKAGPRTNKAQDGAKTKAEDRAAPAGREEKKDKPGIKSDETKTDKQSETPGKGDGKTEVLSLSFSTTSPGGDKRYEPRNVLVVWVEDGNRKFVRTIGRWAGRQKRNLKEWKIADGTDVDGMTGATRKTYGAYTVEWDLKDRKGNAVADGKYTIRMELTNHNAKKNQFHRTRLTFNKNGKPFVRKIRTQDGYKTIRLEYSGRP